VSSFKRHIPRKTYKAMKLDMKLNSLSKKGIQSIVVASTAFLLSSSPLLTTIDDLTTGRIPLISTANADSTGKYSTKLTARRRYRPRIVNAIPVFQDISQSKMNLDASKEYVTSEMFDDLVRAMRLYGVSLRKGELLDDVSRKIDKIVDSFESNCKSFAKSVSKETLNTCVADFNEYVKFTEVEQ
jgi:hypothetical protein